MCFCLFYATDESSRVFLQPIRGLDGSDYINASFVDVSRQQISAKFNFIVSHCDVFVRWLQLRVKTLKEVYK